MNLNVFIDQVVVQAGGQLQPPDEAASGRTEGAGAQSGAVAAPPAGPASPSLVEGQRIRPPDERQAQPQGEPPYWDSGAPREPPLEEGSTAWRLARRPAQV